MSVLAIILVMVVEMLEATQRSLAQARRQVSQFTEASVAFETVTRHVGQATLQTYLAYDNPTNPNAFVRESQLHFVSGEATELLGTPRAGQAGATPTHALFFQGPFGFTLSGQDTALRTSASFNDSPTGVQGNVLNSWGYFIEFGSDEFWRPEFMNSASSAPSARERFRLMEFRPPAENNLIYKPNPRLPAQGANNNRPYLFNMTSTRKEDYRYWFTSDQLGGVNSGSNYDTTIPLGSFRSIRPVAENIIALIILPKTGDARLDFDTSESDAFKQVLYDGYEYDSRYWQWLTGGNHAADLPRVAENSKNVLPPVVEIVMVAIDEVSADNVVTRDSVSALENLVNPVLFRNPALLENDISSLEMDLQDRNVAYRTFRTSVVLRESNWSEVFGN